MKETRDEIVAKLETKKGSVEKLQAKSDSLKAQREMYLAAIEEYKEKILKLEALVNQRAENAESYDADTEVRAGEVEHMEEILERHDKAVDERAKSVAKIQEIIESYPEWMPGMDEDLRGGYQRDAQFKKLSARRDYLDTVIDSALPDVKKIFYSRGVVSVLHEKGRKGV